MVMRRLTFNLFQVSSLHVTYVRSYANLSIARTPDLIYNIKAAWADRWLISLYVLIQSKWSATYSGNIYFEYQNTFLTNLVISI